MDGLFDHIPTGLLLLDSDARIVRANTAARALLEVRSEDGLDWPRAMRPRASLIARAAGRVERSGQPSTLDLTVGEINDRRILHLTMNPAPSTPDAGSAQPIVVASLIDVTAERQAVGVELEARTVIQQLLELARDAIVVVDAEGVVIAANGAAMTLFDRPADALHGRPLSDWLTTAAGAIALGGRDDAPITVQRVGRDEALLARVVPIRHEGRRRSVVQVHAPAPDPVAVIDGDEARLARAGRIGAAIAHDLNNLLTVIGLTASGLADDGVDGQEHVADLMRAYRRARTLVGQMLDLSRPAETPPVRMRVERLIDDALAIARPRGADAVDLRVEVDVDQPVIVERELCVRALTNLMVNAADALVGARPGASGPRGTVRVTARLVPRPADMPPDVSHAGAFLALEVADDGPGMSPDIAARIFEPMFTTKPPDQGTGLGLTVVSDCALEHDGWVRLSTAVGQGARFCLYLPHVDRVARELPDSHAISVVPTDRQGTIVVGDPDPSVARSIAAALERRGYRVASSTVGAEAFRLIDAWTADAAVLSSGMLIDGRPAWRRARLRWPQLPLVVSGRAQPGALSGPVVIVPKPFRPGELDAALVHLLSGAAGEASGAPSQC